MHLRTPPRPVGARCSRDDRGETVPAASLPDHLLNAAGLLTPDVPPDLIAATVND